MNTNAITLSIDSNLDDVRLVGISGKALGSHFGLDESCVDEVEICEVEAVNNAIEHAYLYKPDKYHPDYRAFKRRGALNPGTEYGPFHGRAVASQSRF